MASPDIQKMMGEYDTKHQEAERILGLSADIGAAVIGGATSGSPLVDLGIRRLGAYTAETGEHFRSLEEQIADSEGKVAILNVESGQYAAGEGWRRVLPQYSLTYWGVLEGGEAVIDDESLQLRLPTARFVTRGHSISTPLLGLNDPRMHEGSMPVRDYEEGYRDVVAGRSVMGGKLDFRRAARASALGQKLFQEIENPKPGGDYNRPYIETKMKIVTHATARRGGGITRNVLDMLKQAEKTAAVP